MTADDGYLRRGCRNESLDQQQWTMGKPVWTLCILLQLYLAIVMLGAGGKV